MTRMGPDTNESPIEEVAERMRAVWRPVALVLSGVAVVLLVWAAALGLWARLVAARPVADGAWYLDRLHRWGDRLPDGMAIAVGVVAVLLIAAMAFSYWRGRTGRLQPGLPAGVAALTALLFFAYFSQGIPAFYRLMMQSFPVTASVPAGVAAWGLSFAGAAATLLGAAAFPQLTRGGMRLVGVGAAIAVVAATVVTVGALRAGDDGRYVDATTAAATEAPPTPTAVGQRAFTVSVPDGIAGDPPRPQVAVVAAGPGFVVFKDNRVTAYGVDGKERWHYARTGPGEVAVNAMRVFDHGATVVLSVNDALIGVDATTGEQLWSSADSRMVYALSQEPGYNLVVPYLVYRDAQSWVRYDTRSGTPMWTVPAPYVQCDIPPRAVDTRSWLVTVFRCESDGGVDIRVTAHDPANGETRWDTVVSHGGPGLDAVATPANARGVFMQFGGDQSPHGVSYVNVVDKSVTALPPRGDAQPSIGPGDDFAFSGWDDARQLVLFGPDGKERCTVTGDVLGVQTQVPGQGNGLAYVPFEGSFVVADRDRLGAAGSLRTFDSATCAQTAAVPAAAVVGLVPVPGAVLVLRRDDRTLQIDGYTAG
ncbi:PQQ-like beta-propeller repeat protein [Mycobacterium sp. 21AC1]|uniref:outer membrane protein assembly factor BamB family protein n=1 Tax=[Mycobacterium] appelbergii TaxID=2939269 RepID=UPI0029390DAC|nr:PQQ-binding-like beta-propeller repeat protein [Mycobacterium sp. 21AC1]MDV3130031.1 PQQ-like beta-propeller repeat protein [Mycobacterium sp. 21AC1]